MPLPPPAAREDIHTRRVTCRGYRRADGLWDVEGHLSDVKAYAFPNEHRGGRIEPGDPLHDMALRLTVDDKLVIRKVEACIDKGPYGICNAVAPAFEKLEGLRIGPGFGKKTKELLGGVHGCTHLVELLGPMATTAFQTVYPILARERAAAGEPDKPERQRPALLNSCHVYASDGELVRRRWPDFYTGDRRRDRADAAADAGAEGADREG
jgi:hypothetical protein